MVAKTLRSHYAKFETRADCGVVLGELYTNGFVDVHRKAELDGAANSILRNR